VTCASELPLEVISHESFPVTFRGEHEQGGSSLGQVGGDAVVGDAVFVVVQVLGEDATGVEQFGVGDLFLRGYCDAEDLDVFGEVWSKLAHTFAGLGDLSH